MAAIGTPVVPVVVPSNYSLMAMAFSPLEEVLKQTEAMLPVIMIVLAVAVPVVRSVWKTSSGRGIRYSRGQGGNGLTHTPGGGGRIAIKTNGNLTLGTVALDGYRPGTLHISGATATNSINLSSGTITFDTTHGYWHHTSGIHGMGSLSGKRG